MSGPGSIRYRNKENSIEAQTQLWRAMCDKPKTIRKFVTDDCVMAELDNKLYTPESSPTTREYLDEHFEPWTAYRIHGDPEFVEVDMMSASLIYRVTAWRQDDDGQMVPTEAMCTSVWRQGAGGAWKCCVHHMTKVV